MTNMTETADRLFRAIGDEAGATKRGRTLAGELLSAGKDGHEALLALAIRIEHQNPGNKTKDEEPSTTSRRTQYRTKMKLLRAHIARGWTDVRPEGDETNATLVREAVKRDGKVHHYEFSLDFKVPANDADLIKLAIEAMERAIEADDEALLAFAIYLDDRTLAGGETEAEAEAEAQASE